MALSLGETPKEIIPMTAVATVGAVQGLSEEFVVEWTIPQFSTLSQKVDDYYESPQFIFLNTCWYLRIFCNGESEYESEGYTGLYLMVKEMATLCTITYTLGLKNARGDLECHIEAANKFENNQGWGPTKFFKNLDIALRSSEVLPNDVLTVRCSLMSRSFPKVSLLDRLLNVSRSMTQILEGKQQTDIVLKVEDREIQAHRVILEARSEVFQKMLSHDMLEKRTGEIKIEDMEADVLQELLAYMYGGMAEVTPENARPLYIAADRFNLEELKTLCLEFMKENVSDDLFCDAYVVADMYDETDLMQVLKEYLKEHSESIIETEKWRKFAAEDPVRSLQILTTFVKINADKSRSK